MDGAQFAWGDELTPGGRWMANWLVHDLHRLRVLATYRDLERHATAA